MIGPVPIHGGYAWGSSKSLDSKEYEGTISIFGRYPADIDLHIRLIRGLGVELEGNGAARQD